MEVERNVQLEVILDREDPKGEAIAGFSSGPRTMDELPAYTREELLASLGDVGLQIQALFSNTPADSEQPGVQNGDSI